MFLSVNSVTIRWEYFTAMGFTAPGFRATITLYNTRNAAYGVVYFVFSGQALRTRCRRLNDFLSYIFRSFSKKGIIRYFSVSGQEWCPLIQTQKFALCYICYRRG